MNALGNDRVVEYVNEHFVSTYPKVGTFRVINGQKVGGNVASYFCLADGSVLHAVPGQVTADKFLNEARWAYEVRKAVLTKSTKLAEGTVDARKYRELMKQAHLERFNAEAGPRWGNKQSLPLNMPRTVSPQAQAHWLLATRPMAEIDDIYPRVWTQILREELSLRPVEKAQ